MFKASDFILNPGKLEKEYQLVEVNEWKDYETKNPVGFYYTVLLPKLKFEKLKVGVKSAKPAVSMEELDKKDNSRLNLMTCVYGAVFIMAACLQKQKPLMSRKQG